MRTPLVSFTTLFLISVSAAALAVDRGGAGAGGGGFSGGTPSAPAAPAPVASGGHFASPGPGSGGGRGIHLGAMGAGGAMGGRMGHGYAMLSTARPASGVSFIGSRAASANPRAAVGDRQIGVVVGALPRSAAAAVRASKEARPQPPRSHSSELPRVSNSTCLGGGPTWACPAGDYGFAWQTTYCTEVSYSTLGYSTGSPCGGGAMKFGPVGGNPVRSTR